MTRAKDISKILTDADISGNIDVDGVTNLDVVDIDGAVDFASTTAHSGNATFADNAKAIFGSELEIYSDATHARIKENGSGQLKIQGNNMQLLTSDGTATYLEGNASTGVTTLYHASNAPKIATTSTGVNVTGGIGLGGTGAANLLDDYEEGTWTPTLGGNTTYTQQFGRYTKIGNLVTLQCVIIVGTLGTGSATTLQGLPFAQESTGFSVGSISISYMGQNGVALIYPTGYVTNNAATITFSGMNGSNTTFQLNGFGMFGNGTHLQFSVSYRTA